MKFPIRHLAASVILSHLVIAGASVHAEETLVNLTLETSEPNAAPMTQKYASGVVATEVDSLRVSENNKVIVVKDSPGYTGKALRFIKDAPDPRTPWAILLSDTALPATGKYKFTWESSIDSFSSSEKFPGGEALLNFVLLNRSGAPFLSFFYLVGKDEAGGIFGFGNKKLPANWIIATKQQFEVLLDLDAKTVTIKVDGDQIGEPFPLPPNADGLRIVEFTDGTGIANYDGKFTATVANFKMTSL